MFFSATQPITLAGGPEADHLRELMPDIALETLVWTQNSDMTPDQIIGIAQGAYPFQFAGFLRPVKSMTDLNQKASGQAIPIKFDLGGDEGMALFRSNSPSVVQIDCETRKEIGTPQPAVMPGSTTLHYDAVTRTYQYVWKTDPAWKGTCRRFDLGLIDNSKHSAAFSFK